MYYPYGIWQLQSNAVLPLVYDEALSYGQQIAHLLHRVNELQQDIITVGNILQNGNWTQRIDELAVQLNNLVDQQDQTVTELNKLMGNLTALQGQTNDLSAKVSSLELTVISYINEMTLNNQKIITDLVNSVKQMVLEQICTRNGENMLVRDPKTGYIISLNATLKNMLEVMASFGGLTMEEYAALKLTMAEYRDLQLTMFRYAYAFRLLLIQKSFTENENKFNELEKKIEKQNEVIEYNTTGFNPLTNGQSTAFQLASQLATYTSLAPTVSQYRSYNYNMATYAKLKLTMNKYRDLAEINNFKNKYNQYNNLDLITIARNWESFTLFCWLMITSENITSTGAEVVIGVSGSGDKYYYVSLPEIGNNYQVEQVSGATIIRIPNYRQTGRIHLTLTFFKEGFLNT